jgi:hypothetical protein
VAKLDLEPKMKLFRVLLLGGALALALMIPASAAAQGCALCYTQAAGAGQKMIQALKSGILVLVVPPMGISVLLTFLCYKKRNKFHSVESVSSASEQRTPNADLGW